MSRLSSARPALATMAYTAIAVLPLYLVGAFSVHLQADLGFGTSQLGLVVGAFFATGATFSLAAAPLVDRMGASIALRVGAGASVAASLSAVFVARSWRGLAGAMALCGLAHAATQVGSNRVLATRAVARRRAASFGAKQAAVPIASLSAGLVAASLGQGDVARQAFLAAAGLAAVAGLSVPHIDRMGSTERRDPSEPIRRPPRLYALAVAAGMSAAAGNSLPLLIVDSLETSGLDVAVAASLLAVGSTLTMTTRVGMGVFVDSRASDGSRELQALLLLGAAGFTLLAASNASIFLLVPGLLLAFTGGWGWQGLAFFSAAGIEGVPPATATGVVLAGTMSGSALGPPSVAFLADSFGYTSGWMLAASLLVLGALTSHRSWGQGSQAAG